MNNQNQGASIEAESRAAFKKWHDEVGDQDCAYTWQEAWRAARRTPAATTGDRELPISDAEIAGFMGWRGPGAYTEASLRKIRRIVEHAIEADRAQQAATLDAYRAQHARLIAENADLRAQIALHRQDAPIYQVKSILHPHGWHDETRNTYEWNKANGIETRIVYAAPKDAQASAPLAQQAKLICPQCGVDRLKAPCPTMADECAMIGDAHLLAAPAAQPAAPTLMRQAVACVDWRDGDELGVRWLRPERVDVGALLYCAAEPVAALAAQQDQDSANNGAEGEKV